MGETDIEIIKEFVIESSENLARLDREMVELEKHPQDANLLASIFRTIHTVKGTCGFLGFGTLERITHHAENILSQVRNGERALTPELVSLILETVDAVKAELTSIEATSNESGEPYAGLLRRQEAAVSQVQAGREAMPGQDTQDTKDAIPAPACEMADPPAEPDPPVETPRRPVELEPDGGPKTVSASDSTIRVDVGLLDKLMNLVGELVLARNQVLQFSARQDDASLNATSQRLNLITTELQASVMKTRMQPIGMIWNKLPRVVRDLAAACGKQIGLEMDGADTELDKTIIEAIKDPLTHIVRNSGDHGIETPDERVRAGKPARGRLMLRAFHEGGNVNIEISDDGAGIDPQKLKASALQKGLLRLEQADRMHDRELVNLVFLPGFSTAAKVSNISGRGVGMDVVKTNIEKIGGTVDLSSKLGQGTVVKIKIPLTLAIIPGLVVTSGGERFVIPQVSLLELVRLEGEQVKKQIERIHGTPVYRRRGSLLPLAYLNGVLKMRPEEGGTDSEVINIIVLQAEDRQFGLVVDGINDTQEIVVKPLGKQLKGVSCYAGATIMGDGKVALILDVAGIAQLSGVIGESRSTAHGEDAQRSAASHVEKQSLLLFRSGRFERLAVPLSLVARLEEFPLSKIERAAGRMVVQYRGQILPLVLLAGQLDSDSSEAASTQDPAQVVVFADGERRIGLLVDQIVDIVEETVSVKKASDHAGLLGSAVVGQKITDFLDLHAVIQGVEDGWFQQQSTTLQGATVLVTEISAFSRGLLRNYLEMAGHRVIEAASAVEAMDRLGKETVDVVVTALDLPDRSAFQLLESIGREPALRRIPVVALTDRVEQTGAPAGGVSFSDYLLKFDRTAMLRSVDRLSHTLDAHEPEQAAELLATGR
jgi:two-component system chemotaxis sensor kinase CheA